MLLSLEGGHSKSQVLLHAACGVVPKWLRLFEKLQVASSKAVVAPTFLCLNSYQDCSAAQNWSQELPLPSLTHTRQGICWSQGASTAREGQEGLCSPTYEGVE